MGEAARRLEEPEAEALAPEMIAFADHLAELLAEEFVRAMKEGQDEGGNIRSILERESA